MEIGDKRHTDFEGQALPTKGKLIVPFSSSIPTKSFPYHASPQSLLYVSSILY